MSELLQYVNVRCPKCYEPCADQVNVTDDRGESYIEYRCSGASCGFIGLSDGIDYCDDSNA